MVAMILTAALAGPPLGETDTHTYVSRVDSRIGVVRPFRARLSRIAQCESGGRWHIATGNGFYGGLQFLPSSWWAVGGTGLPHYRSKLEQMYRAVRLMRLQGWGAWPVCRFR